VQGKKESSTRAHNGITLCGFGSDGNRHKINTRLRFGYNTVSNRTYRRWRALAGWDASLYYGDCLLRYTFDECPSHEPGCVIAYIERPPVAIFRCERCGCADHPTYHSYDAGQDLCRRCLKIGGRMKKVSLRVWLNLSFGRNHRSGITKVIKVKMSQEVYDDEKLREQAFLAEWEMWRDEVVNGGFDVMPPRRRTKKE
jgi:hypothetical protein